MQSRKLKTLLSMILVLVSSVSFGEEAITDELQKLGDRTARLEAQLKVLELENKVAQQTNDLTARGKAATRSASSLELDSDYGTPTVSYVEGAKGSLEALLQYRGNVRQRVKEGDTVYGALVKKISLNEVVLTDIKSRTNVRLQFGSAPVTRDTPTTGSVPTILPTGMPTR